MAAILQEQMKSSTVRVNLSEPFGGCGWLWWLWLVVVRTYCLTRVFVHTRQPHVTQTLRTSPGRLRHPPAYRRQKQGKPSDFSRRPPSRGRLCTRPKPLRLTATDVWTVSAVEPGGALILET